MLDDFWHIAAAKIIVRHKIKMRLNFVGIIRGKSFSDRNLQALALDFCLFVIRFLIGQVARGLVKQLQTSDSFQSDHASALVPWPSAKVSSIKASKFFWCFTILANSATVAGSSRFLCCAILESVRWWSTSRISDLRCSDDSCRRVATRWAKSALASEWGRAPMALPVSCKSNAR